MLLGTSSAGPDAADGHSAVAWCAEFCTACTELRNQLPNRFRPRSCGRALALATGEGRPAKLLGFDGQGWIQAIGGLVIGLIALYSSFDHVYLLSHRITLHRQWGVWFIAASLAVVFLDAQLASRSRRGEEDRRIQDARTAAEERDRADQERNRAAQERNRATEARERQAAAAERQGQGIAFLRGAALLSARVQLDPSELNRSRLNAFLALLAEQALLDQLGPE